MSSTVTYPQAEPARSTYLTQLKTWITAHRWALIAVTVVLIGAAGVRLLTYQHYLPYMDNHDESYMFLLTRAFRGFPEEFIAKRLSGYPPLYIWFQSGVQQLFETYSGRPWFLPTDYIYVLRHLAVVMGVITTAFVVAIGWQLGGSIAGIFAGLIWGFAPIIVDNNSLALADPVGYLACAAAVAFAIRAWQKNSLWALFGSLIGAIAAIYVKYWTLYPVLLWGIVALRILWIRRKAALPGLAAQVVFGIAAAGGLLRYVSGSGLSAISPEMSDFTGSGLANALDMPRNLNNISYFPVPMGVALFYGVLVAGIVAFIISRYKRWQVVDWRWAGILVLCALFAVIPVSTFIYVSSVKYIRHAIPVTILLIGLWSMGITQILGTIRKLTGKSSVVIAGVLFLGAVTLVPYVVDTAGLVKAYEQTPVYQLLWTWADTNVPLDGKILMDSRSDVESTWNRAWSGYDKSKSFEWWFEDGNTTINTSPEDYAERGILYFAMSDVDRLVSYKDVNIDRFVNKLTLLKHIPAAPDVWGEGVWFYRMIPPQVQPDADFGGQIRLAGYDLSADAVKAGDSITFRPYWQADKRPDTNYSMFIHLYPADEDTLLAQYDGAPASTARLTLTWDDPTELLIGQDVNLQLPADLDVGDYRLVVGLYDFNSGARLALPDGATYFTIPVTVEK
jgi:hypothetical protein